MGDGGPAVAVLGATGIVGRELLRVLASARGFGEVQAAASGASVMKTVDFGDEQLSIRRLDPELLESVDLVFSAMPPGAGRELVDGWLEDGGALVDLCGERAAEGAASLVVTGLAGEDLDGFRERRAVAVPGPVTLAAARLLGPLEGVSGIGGLALLPATLAGRAGVEELSGQVVAMFNAREPPRSVFPHGLAFDLLPGWGPAGALGWTEIEERVRRDLPRLVGIPGDAVAVGVAVAPLFTGMAMALQVGGVGVESVLAGVESSPHLLAADGGRLLVRRQVGSPAVAVGRVRAAPDGLDVHLWASADPPSMVASEAVAVASAIVEEGLL